MVDWLWNKVRTFVFRAGSCPRLPVALCFVRGDRALNLWVVWLLPGYRMASIDG